AVVELHSLADLEGPHLAVARNFPLLGQRRLDLGGGTSVFHQAVVELSRDARGDAVRDDRGVELDGLALRAEDECLSRCRSREGERRDDQERERVKAHAMNLLERAPGRPSGRLIIAGLLSALTQIAKSVVWSVHHDRLGGCAALPRKLAGRSRQRGGVPRDGGQRARSKAGE